MKIRLIFWIVVYFVTFVIMLIGFNYYYISLITKDRLYDSFENIPQKKVALVLGTSKYLSNGQENYFFTNRINAAHRLFKSKKVKFILVSGDNSILNYNEPAMMKKALIEKGVPDSVIYSDYAGFRTLDAVIRCKKVFLEDDIIIISQKFHNERALFLASHFDVNAIGLNAKDIEFTSSYNVIFREYLARLKALLDVYFFKTKPKFLGEPIKID